MCVCIHTHTCVEHTEVQAYGGQRLVSFCCSYFLRQGFWWNMDGTHDSDRLAGHWSAEMRLLSPMPQHCGYRWVLPPWLLYECWGPEFRPHANAVILHQVSHLSSSFYHSWYWTCLYWKLFILINLIFWQLWSYFLPCHLEISTDVPRLSVRLRAFFPFQLGLLTTPLWPCFTSSPNATIALQFSFP